MADKFISKNKIDELIYNYSKVSSSLTCYEYLDPLDNSNDEKAFFIVYYYFDTLFIHDQPRHKRWRIIKMILEDLSFHYHHKSDPFFILSARHMFNTYDRYFTFLDSLINLISFGFEYYTTKEDK